MTLKSGVALPAARRRSDAPSAGARRVSGVAVRRYTLAGVLLIIAVLWLMPLFWALSTSLKVAAQVIRPVPEWIPSPLTLDSYAAVFSSARNSSILFPLLNSIIIAVLSAVLTVFVSAAAAFPLARMQFRGRNLIFAIIIGSLMVPDIVTLVPSYLIVAYLGWLNTYQALVVPYIASPFGVFLMRQFFLSIPNEMVDAARVDGANAWQVLTRLFLPLSRPAVVALTIFTVRNAWNDFTWPLIVLTSYRMETLTVALAQLKDAFTMESYGPIMAGAVISAVPILIVFVVANRYIVEGVQLSGMKG
jgi:multiple sugar transport system permease protein